METLEWPAESPDLNLVEACRRDVETEFGEIWGRAADAEALQLYLAVCWARVATEERLDALVESIDAGGGGPWVRHDLFPPHTA